MGEKRDLARAWKKLDLELLDKLFTWDPLYHEQIREIAKALQKCRVIGDLCTGFGHLAKYLIKKGKTVHGIDISQDALDYATHTVGSLGKGKFTPVLSDMYHLPYSSYFDGISCLSNIGATSDIQGLAREVERSLKPQGIFALTSQEPKQAKNYEAYAVTELTYAGGIKLTRDQADRARQIREE